MDITEQTILQVERFLRKVAQKFPESEETSVLTDIHVRVSQDSGELLAFDDDDKEITRCVVEQWIDNKDENFYDEVAKILRELMRRNADLIDSLGIILKPYSFVLEDDDKENLGELYLADDDTVIVGGDLMEGLDSDLDSFFDDLLKEDS